MFWRDYLHLQSRKQGLGLSLNRTAQKAIILDIPILLFFNDPVFRAWDRDKVMEETRETTVLLGIIQELAFGDPFLHPLLTNHQEVHLETLRLEAERDEGAKCIAHRRQNHASLSAQACEFQSKPTASNP